MTLDHLTDEEINAASYQSGGDGWQVMRFVADDGSYGHCLYHEKFQPDPAVGDITVPEMVSLAKELLKQAEIAIAGGARINGNGAQGREGGAC